MLGTAHLHATSWLLVLILFFVVLTLYKKGNEKAGKIVHMILRLLFLLTFLSGGMLAHTAFSAYPIQYTLKMIFGILVIGFIEMLLGSIKKNQNPGMFWVLFVIFLVATLYLGYFLPMGYKFF